MGPSEVSGDNVVVKADDLGPEVAAAYMRHWLVNVQLLIIGLD